MLLKQAAANAQPAATPPLIPQSTDYQTERPDACRAHNTQYVADNNLGAGHQLQTVNGAEHARELLSAPLTLSLFRTAEAELFSRGGYQRCCWRPLHAWLRSRLSELLTPLHRCVRRPTTGVDAFARIGQAGSKRALTVRERSIRAQTKDGDLSFQDRLCSSLRDGWMLFLELLGVFG